MRDFKTVHILSRKFKGTRGGPVVHFNNLRLYQGRQDVREGETNGIIRGAEGVETGAR